MITDVRVWRVKLMRNTTYGVKAFSVAVTILWTGLADKLKIIALLPISFIKDIIQDIFLPIFFLLPIRLWLAHDLHDRSIVTYYNVTSYYYLCDCSHIPSTHPLTSSGESVIKFITRFAVMRVNELALKQNGFGHELTNEHIWRPRRRTFQTKRQCQLMEKSLPEQGFNWRAKCKSFPWENNSKDRKNKQP